MSERKIIPQELHGETVNCEELKFETIKEDWNDYRLEDGTVVRVKTVVAKIFRVLDADNNPAFTETGEPRVLVRWSTLVSASE